MATVNKTNFEKGKLQKYIPLVIAVLYLSLTVLLFAFGPINYPVENKLYFYSFLVMVNLMLTLGYMIGINKKELVVMNEGRGLKVFRKAMVIYIILIPFTNYLNTGSFIFNLNAVFDLGQAYKDSYTIRQGRSIATVISYLRIILSPFLLAYVPLGLFYWSKLTNKRRTIYVLGLLGGLGLDFFRGTNKSIADFLIVLLVILLINSIYKARIPRKSIIQYKLQNRNLLFLKRIFATIFISILGFIGFIYYFSNTAPKRYGVNIYGPNNEYMIDVNHKLLSLFSSNDVRLALGSLISYFTQGYYALGLAMQKEFMPTFGIGSSMAVLINVSNLFDTNKIFERTYVYRNYIENGWDWHGKWSSFYVWVASDVSFFGVLIIISILGYILARSWNRLINYRDYISVIVFTQLMIMIFYLPANNQLFQFFEGLVGNIFWITVWVMSVRRIRIKW
ncbi:hypothetical protein [Proteiniborus sp. MB09-C3]|uniref:hypothetical protein n=1 Tax=Proteiniborus sp. MB09-C3 TaxID=3050072 RepID=UPI0025578824|nr:hypothetical protein [Proteiniborus sp. MB09-C3]WIV12113.1 hypothetical protein QO263_18765 [Proteiniborus sp. MB09-C3]